MGREYRQDLTTPPQRLLPDVYTSNLFIFIIFILPKYSGIREENLTKSHAFCPHLHIYPVFISTNFGAEDAPTNALGPSWLHVMAAMDQFSEYVYFLSKHTVLHIVYFFLSIHVLRPCHTVQFVLQLATLFW